MRFFIFIFAILFIGCKAQIQYVPNESVKSDTTYVFRFKVDSVYQKDSVYVNVKGDTVTEYRYKYVYRYVNNTDTVYISKVDSISVPYPVEAKLSAWQQTKVNYGGWAMAFVLVFILSVVGNIIYKIKMR